MRPYLLARALCLLVLVDLVGLRGCDRVPDVRPIVQMTEPAVSA